jgi:hypothetical protein
MVEYEREREREREIYAISQFKHSTGTLSL